MQCAHAFFSRGAAAASAAETHKAQGLVRGSRMWNSGSGRGITACPHTSPSRGTGNTGKHVSPLLPPCPHTAGSSAAPRQESSGTHGPFPTGQLILAFQQRPKPTLKRLFFQFPSSSVSPESTSTPSNPSWCFPAITQPLLAAPAASLPCSLLLEAHPCRRTWPGPALVLPNKWATRHCSEQTGL